MEKYISGLGVLATSALVITLPAPVLGATFTVAGVEFDTDFAVTEGAVILDGSGGQGLETFGNTFPAPNTVGSFFTLGNPPRRSVELGNDDLAGENSYRDIIQLSWGGNTIGNQAGWDFAIFENGDRNEPEPFLVSVRDARTGLFSDFLYRPEEAFDEAAKVFVTRFDLSFFGVDFIDSVQIANGLPADFDPDFADRFGGPTSDRWDADITYVVASNFSDIEAIPEPGLLLGLGVLSLAGWFLKK